MAESPVVDPYPQAGASPGRDRRAPLPRARVVVASTAGIFVESLDWAIYGLVAPYFAEQVFPERTRRPPGWAPTRCSPRGSSPGRWARSSWGGSPTCAAAVRA